MQDGQNARQQIVERTRQATSILVAVGNNPSVDALSAAIGLALMLNKLDKHTTALFSGQIPPAIQFLEPNKLFEDNVDSLRDFIISLDKEKADRLRYKVEEDVVRIFITPYKTRINEKDLEFSQGDYNVDLIIALGVEKREDLDKVIIAHGRILHDATVVTLTAQQQISTLGSINWNDASSSSLCEMLVSMSEAFQQPGLLDAQISTALLTGIVAATERFSNNKTSPRVMTMAAQLMAAGANQQLIATNLAKAHQIPEVAVPKKAPEAEAQQAEPEKRKNGELSIKHEKKAEEKPVEAPKPAEVPKSEPPKEEPKEEPKESPEEELAAALPTSEAPTNVLEDLKKELAEEGHASEKYLKPEKDSPGGSEVDLAEEPDKTEEPEEYITTHGSWRGKRLQPPSMGGTLNATAEEALEDAEKAEDEERNKTLLDHPEDTEKPRRHHRERKIAEPEEKSSEPEPEPEKPAKEPEVQELPVAPLPPPPVPPQKPTETDVEIDHNEEPPKPPDVNTARQAVTEALNAQPFNPANQPQAAIGAQPVAPMPNVPVSEPLSPTALQALPPIPPEPKPGDLPPMPPLPPLPTSETALPPAPNLPGLNQPLPSISEENKQTKAEEPPKNDKPADPGQFKIPGA